MANSKLLKSINKTAFFNRGNRCYGLPLTSMSIIFIRGIRSWSESQLWEFLNKNFSNIINSFISVKFTNHFGDSFFRVKVKLSLEQARSFCEKLETLIPYITASCNKVSHFINKKSFNKIKRGLLCKKSSSEKISTISSPSTTHNINLQPTTSSYTLNSPTSSNTPISSSTIYCAPTDDPNVINQKCSFCLSWNTNGWNFNKRDGIEYFCSIFKPLFLCFQETGNGSKLDDNIFCKVTIQNYRYFRKKAINSPGMRGLYLGYHKTCQASLENNEYNFILSLTTHSLWNHIKCSIGNIYVPQKKHNLERKTALTETASWLRSHTNHASILIGDFNCSTRKLSDFISSFAGWTILPISGSNVSWTRGEFCSDIDHVIINDSLLDKISSALFVDYFPISDHKPLLVQCKDLSVQDPFTLPRNFVRWDRNQCKIVKDSIVNNNHFSILNNEIFNDQSLSIDQMVEKFLSTAKQIANDLNILTPTTTRKKLFEISKTVFYLQKKKRSLYKSIRQKGSLKNISSFLNTVNFYQRVCKSIHKKCNEFRKKEYQHWIEIGCKLAIQQNGRKSWNWMKNTAKIRKNTNFNHPLKNENNQLISSTEDQLKVFHDHYKNLASDPQGTSLSRNYWKNSYIPKQISVEDHCEWDINQEISKEEIKEAILSTPNYKASGPDNIPIEFYKAMLPNGSNSSGNSGLDSLHNLFNKIWDGDFPESWNNASIVSIPKKGDLSDCDNYRGISLINNGIKIISKIVATRISKYGIGNKFIRPAQFGFRNKEECISLYISIRDICQRRQINNEPTYLAFLDLKKAYDSVPIYNILTKLYCLGIRGKCYQFIENLYLTSKACIKKDNQISDSF